jgi:alanyl-tRNA synthetase
MKTAELRQTFLDYFKSRGHHLVDSSPLIPPNDPSLLFTNAGMIQFKEIFLGQVAAHYAAVVSAQCCIRAGGKHNDLDNVGYTARHHTFFEMLGNFSFSAYFKREAIQLAWQFITEELQLPASKLWVTVYSEDDEAADIWRNEIKVPAGRIVRCGERDNFWSMGETGPCGPCTEIFYDHGESVAGGPPGSADADGDRYVEIWNLVFMQYNRDASGQLHPLPTPAVDTGMGLERLAAVMQGVHSNYETDLFQALIKAAADITQCAALDSNSLKVLADHIRAVGFLIAEGVLPSNDGRGYVLRRILRRAIRHGHKLGATEPFFYRLVATLVSTMGDAYPRLADTQEVIETVILKEEQQFAKTLDKGLGLLSQALSALQGDTIPGEVVFKLYDTYGFPTDLTADIAREQGWSIDIAGFDEAMAAQRAKSQAASHFVDAACGDQHWTGTTTFTGYDLTSQTSQVEQIFVDHESPDVLLESQRGIVVLAETPFYAESGGQVGDSGVLEWDCGCFVVEDTQQRDQLIFHMGVVQQGELRSGTGVVARVDTEKRDAVRLNHTATHLLHAALRHVLGAHVLQKGSLVDAQRLRFDFTHFEPLSRSQLQQTEALVNDHIRQNHAVITSLQTPAQAKADGAMALFGEKYSETVRVLKIGEFSKELCGGTHVTRTGDIGLVKIISEAGVAAGVRRLEAVSGAVALAWSVDVQQQLQALALSLKAPVSEVQQKVTLLLESNRQLSKEVDTLQAKLATSSGTDLSSQAETVNGVSVLVTTISPVAPARLRQILDQLKNKLGSAVIVLVSVDGPRLNVVAGVTKDCMNLAPGAKQLVVAICGRGGGREDMAQGGGEVPSDLDARLAQVRTMITEKL